MIKTVKEQLKQALSRRQKRHIVNGSRVPAAVLLPLYCRDGQYYILLTKRTGTVKDHKGELSFPGGACERGDKTRLETALRESAEEIGLKAEAVELLGELDDTITTTSNYIISPFVAAIPWPYPFKIDREEVEEIVEVPISALQDKSSLRQSTEIINGEAISAYAYHYQGRVIWGATARVLNQFLGIVPGLGDK